MSAPARRPGVQALLARLLADEQARLEFAFDSTAFAVGFGLDAAAVELARHAAGPGLELTARTVAAKRCRRLWNSFPLTANLLDGLGRRAATGEAYCHAVLPVWEPGQDYAVILGRGLLDFVLGATLPGMPLYLADLVRYELLRLELVQAGPLPAERRAPPGEALPQPGTAALDAGTLPVLVDHGRLATFEWDVPSVVEPLRMGPAVPTCGPGPVSIVMTLPPGAGAPSVLRLPPSVHDLLGRCDGSRTVGELLAAGAGAEAVLRTCVERGLIRLVGADLAG